MENNFSKIKNNSIFAHQFKGAQLAELVDALDSNSSTVRCAGSIPALGTKKRC